MSNYSKRKEAELLAKKESAKKTVLTIIAVVVVLGIFIGGAWYLKNRSTKDSNTEATATGDPNYDVFDYVTLGKYEGIEANRIIPEVTEDVFNAKKSEILTNAIEYGELKKTERGVEAGDKVTIDFEGKIDGKEFEGGSGTDHEYILGVGDMVPGFDEAYYGTKVGETKTINIKFPKDYHKEEGLAGKDVEFKITVKSAQKVTYQPEWNDEFAKKISEGKYTTIADYEKSVRDDLMKSAEDNSKNTLRNDVWTQVFNSAKIDGYPKYLYNKLKIDLSKNLESAAAQYGCSVEDYLKYFAGGVSMKEYVMQYVNSQLVAEAVKKQLGLDLTDEKYKEYAEADLANFGVKSIEDLEKQYGKDTLLDYYGTEYMHDTLVSKAVVKDVTQEEYNDIVKKDSEKKE